MCSDFVLVGMETGLPKLKKVYRCPETFDLCLTPGYHGNNETLYALFLPRPLGTIWADYDSVTNLDVKSSRLVFSNVNCLPSIAGKL